jgi:photosystem II stability/assembly factor-like uncharacterized protein
MMGRVASIDAAQDDWRRVVVGSASGGVFASRNGGITWDAVFDRYGSGSIGVVALDPSQPERIWVGTGEANNRNSVGWGDGLYRSDDFGKNFVHVGLRDTRQIADLAIDPTDSDTVFCAAVGSLWGSSGDRGLFVSRDGGDTWSKVEGGLPAGVGCTEVVIQPGDPRVLLCGMYERLRSPHSMHSGGPHGGVFKSTDGGRTWRKLTQGLPTGDTGMIDLDFCLSQPQVVLAQVEADESLPADLSVPGPGIYRSDDAGETWRYLLRTNVRPFYHGQCAIDPNDPDRLYSVGREFKVSRDGGRTWVDRWWGGGGDDHDLWIAPEDGRIRYMATDQGAYQTIDDGRTVVGFENMAIGQYYAIGVDMRDPYHVVGGLQDNGLWIGPSNSRELRGILNTHCSWIAEGDGFHAQIDPTDHRTVYTVNHVGFVARQDLETRAHSFVTPTPETVRNFADWFEPEHPDPRIAYTIHPGEHWFFGVYRTRADRPQLPPQFRFNWSSPLVLSPHDPRTLYFGGNHLFETRDRGETWTILSPDLTTDDPQKRRPSGAGGLTTEVTGGENHCTIITIGPSPLDPDLIWCGTDDGRVQLTRDRGASWTDVTGPLFATAGAPGPGAWVSRVEPSHRAHGRCWVTLDDHRRDDYRPHVFVTDDHGASWRSVRGDLPADGSCYVVREDPRNPATAYLGTEFGAFLTTDGGSRWHRIPGLPTVAVHDLVVHPRDFDLVAGTHGRSIWIADDLSAVQQLRPEIEAAAVHLFAPRRATKWARISLGRKQPDFLFQGENPPRAALLHVWLREVPAGRATLSVESLDGLRRWSRPLERSAGIQRLEWNLSFRPNDADRAGLRATLGAAIAKIRAALRADDAARQAELAGIATALDAARDDRALNAVRQRLVDAFAGFALGRPTFGTSLGPIEAPAGTYRVRLELDGEVQETTLEVRDDPLGR